MGEPEPITKIIAESLQQTALDLAQKEDVRFFHYTSAEALFSMIDGDKKARRVFRCGSATFMNDPEEISHAFQTWKDLGQEVPQVPYDGRQDGKGIKERAEIYIGSFSTEGDSLDMWRAYRAEVCLGFRGSWLLDTLEKLKKNPEIYTDALFYEVKYKPENLIAALKEIITYRDETNRLSDAEIRELLVIVGACNKKQGYASEHEYRLIVRAKRPQYYLSKAGRITPYRGVSIQGEPEPIATICTGPQLGDDEARAIAGYVQEKLGITVTRSEHSYRS